MLNATNGTKKTGELTVVNDSDFSVAKGQVAEVSDPEGAKKSALIIGLHSFEDENSSGSPSNNCKSEYFTTLSDSPTLSSLAQGMGAGSFCGWVSKRMTSRMTVLFRAWKA